MPIIYQKWITRADLRANPEKRYVFGDNVMRDGYGGQAREMRGEPNAIGVATKWRPANDATAFFEDSTTCRDIVVVDLKRVHSALREGRTVVVPEDGIGTGLSELPKRAPKLDAEIKVFFETMEAAYR